MTPFLGEVIGTTILLVLGNGVVANVLLKQTNGNNSGWIVITMGWAAAVYVGVVVSATASGAHLNPAVTVGLAVAGKFSWEFVPGYIVAQMLGACLGTTLVWLQHRDHFNITENPDSQLGAFCTAPAIRSTLANLFSEVLATFVLVFAALNISSPKGGLGSLDALPIAMVVLAVGISLGGTTGYAINPARDLGPRIMHTVLPMRGKRDSDWGYAWIPVIGPLIGGALAGILFQRLIML